jgi:signal transduction histidine kinase
MLKHPSQADLESMGLFADVAAHVIHRANLDARVIEAQLKEDRRRLLVWVSMVEDMWQHNLVLKASSIRLNLKILQKRLDVYRSLPAALHTFPEVIAAIDQLAADIANAPPRVPHDSEMKRELVPLRPLLQEIAHRERHSQRLKGTLIHQIEVNVKALGGVQVRGYRRWLIYLIESVLQNAYNAMPTGGQITISGSKTKEWAEIRIRDTGRGVPRRLQDKLFKEAITGRRNHAGLGIGSLLVTTLVEENQGKIELEKPGPGDTTVLITLPIAQKAKKT